ncbi:MAG: YbjN domain-containing protein [Hyphomonas sp.]
MRQILTSLALMAAIAAPAFADDSKIVNAVTLQDLQTILVEQGYTINSTGDDGAVSIRATDTAGSGLIFNVLGTACEVEGYDGCVGINMQVRYDADGQETLERINDANLMWAATSAWYSAGGVDGETPTVGITRYVILDGGMTIRNIKDNLINLLAIAPQAADYIWQVGDYGEGDDEYYDEEW